MSNNSYPAVRLDRKRAAMVFVDHQAGLLLGVQDHDKEELRRNVIALALIAKAFEVPVIMTTSAADGPNGPVISELASVVPDATIVHRPGEIDAMDNPDFAAALRDSGRDQLILSGISTDVCVSFVAQSAIAAGYGAWAVTDASGTWSTLSADAACDRMSRAGVILTSTVAVAAELLVDWRTKGGDQIASIFGQYAIPAYSSLLAFAKSGG
ncbi:isochorismatase family protein [Mycolicibacterium sediminis]|uniref:Hydrolase n=1 Tax=Mycolicibacterium sediminis TaxID=1286180 RepID=A0A7I7QVK8_9MYCO|nr:isochorismatase family protein [Mycolicibacterium sediminis]BBY30322.1 hydrolase [Mycolicibacterium sediminis]